MEGGLQARGIYGGQRLNGNLDMRDERIDAKLLVTLPVTNNLPLAALIVGAPAIGGALFVADKLLGDKVARFASVQYDVNPPAPTMGRTQPPAAATAETPATTACLA